MTSVSRSIKTIPSESAYFINVGSLSSSGNTASRIFNYNPAATNPAFSTATWSQNGAGGVTNSVSTILATPGAAVLKDLGTTVVSSLRTFRKIQLVVSSISSGVSIGAPVANQAGPTGTPVIGEEYYTGYIEVVGAFGTNVNTAGNIAPVVRTG
jgi:hypothetical protein